MTRKEQLAYMVGLIEYSKLDSFSVKQAIEFAKGKGITANMHIGRALQWFTEEREIRVAEYLMGQFVDGYEKSSFYGYNSCINLSMAFFNGQWPREVSHAETQP